MFEKDFPKDDRKGLEDFQNHYNVRLNKCFLFESNMVLSKVDGKATSSQFMTLVDVNDNKSVGSFSPLGCEVGEKKCGSAQEFMVLIRPYMKD